MPVILIGLGCGAECITREGREALNHADIIIGSARMLKQIEEIARIQNTDTRITDEKIAAVRPEEILRILRDYKRPCVLYGGDPGFHSGARGLIALLEKNQIAYRVIPGISTMQVLSAR